jgi:hypothetical protein
MTLTGPSRLLVLDDYQLTNKANRYILLCVRRKSFEQSPRRPSSSVPNRNPLQPILELPRRGTIYRAPETLRAVFPPNAALAYLGSVPIPYHFRTKSISPYLPASSYFARLYQKTPRVAFPVFPPAQNGTCPVAQICTSALSILPAPTLRASNAILLRERGSL